MSHHGKCIPSYSHDHSWNYHEFMKYNDRRGPFRDYICCGSSIFVPYAPTSCRCSGGNFWGGFGMGIARGALNWLGGIVSGFIGGFSNYSYASFPGNNNTTTVTTGNKDTAKLQELTERFNKLEANKAEDDNYDKLIGVLEELVKAPLDDAEKENDIKLYQDLLNRVNKAKEAKEAKEAKVTEKPPVIVDKEGTDPAPTIIKSADDLDKFTDENFGGDNTQQLNALKNALDNGAINLNDLDKLSPKWRSALLNEYTKDYGSLVKIDDLSKEALEQIQSIIDTSDGIVDFNNINEKIQNEQYSKESQVAASFDYQHKANTTIGYEYNKALSEKWDAVIFVSKNNPSTNPQHYVLVKVSGQDNQYKLIQPACLIGHNKGDIK